MREPAPAAPRDAWIAAAIEPENLRKRKSRTGRSLAKWLTSSDTSHTETYGSESGPDGEGYSSSHTKPNCSRLHCTRSARMIVGPLAGM